MEDRIKNLFFRLFFIALIPACLFCHPSEREKQREVIRVLSDKSIPFEERSLLADYGGFGASLLVRSPANEVQSPGTFVLAVPLDAEFAVDTALFLSKKLYEPMLSPANILVAFLADERNELPPDLGGISHKGLRDLLSLTNMPENLIICYLDADEAPGEVIIRRGSREYAAPLEIISPLPSLFLSRDISWSFGVEGSEALALAWAEEVNSFVLAGKNNNGKTVNAENFALLLLDYAAFLSFPVLKADRHYSYFSLPGGRVFFVSEGLTAVLPLVIMGFFLLPFLMYSVRRSAILFFRVRLFIRSFWFFLLLLFLLVMSVRFSGFLYALMLRLKPPQQGSSSAGVVLTLVLSALIFFLPSPLLSRFPLSEKARLFGFSAAVFSIIGMFSAALFDFSYVPLFVWAAFFVLPGASVSNPVLIFLSAFLVPVLPLAALFNVFETGSAGITALVLSSDLKNPESWRIAFQIALLPLSVYLLVKRGLFLLPKTRQRKYRLSIIPVFATVIAMVIQILLLPERKVPPERRFIAAEGDEIITLNLDDVIFQDSRIITVRIGASGIPIRFDLAMDSLNGESLLPVYSSTVPFERDTEGRNILFFPGENCPNPLLLEIVVPLKFNCLLSGTAVYNTWDNRLDPGGKPASDDYVLRVSRSIELGI